jgi:ABC-2 type transport system permease protein
MNTNSTIDQPAVATTPQTLVPVRDKTWLGGFGNILAKELRDWFGTRRWWMQALLWVIIFNGLLAVALNVIPQAGPIDARSGEGLFMTAITEFLRTAALLGSIGIIVLSQDEIIQEKQSGTLAWILSKPVSRTSLLLSKLIANTLGGLIFIIAIPGLIAYLELWLASGIAAPVGPYLLSLAVLLLTLFFYITLSLLLGVVFDQRGPVLAGTFGVLIGGLILTQFVPKLAYILPLSMDKAATALLQQQPLPSALSFELISAGLFSILFIVAALWIFEEAEL